jgi:heme oxygenase (biliverdin-producing, ferredoxin)
MELSTRLRQATQDLHGVAERSGMMPSLLRGQLSRRDYTLLLRNLQLIYAALERGLAHASAPVGVDFTPLYRAAALAKDLAFLSPEPGFEPCEATQRYVARLEQLAASDPRLLIAHAYVRYLGDLHGGQLLRRCVARVLQVEDGQGLDFYDFGPAERVAQLIHGFRVTLNGLALEASEAEAMAQEARLGFALHIDIFEQLSPALNL